MTDASLLLHVTYTLKAGKRDAFLRAAEEGGVAEASRREAGNLRYQYFCPVGDENSVFLVEHWADETAFKAHLETAHYKKLGEIKSAYVESVSLARYRASEIQ